MLEERSEKRGVLIGEMLIGVIYEAALDDRGIIGDVLKALFLPIVGVGCSNYGPAGPSTWQPPTRAGESPPEWR